MVCEPGLMEVRASITAELATESEKFWIENEHKSTNERVVLDDGKDGTPIFKSFLNW